MHVGVRMRKIWFLLQEGFKGLIESWKFPDMPGMPLIDVLPRDCILSQTKYVPQFKYIHYPSNFSSCETAIFAFLDFEFLTFQLSYSLIPMSPVVRTISLWALKSMHWYKPDHFEEPLSLTFWSHAIGDLCSDHMFAQTKYSAIIFSRYLRMSGMHSHEDCLELS